MRTITAAIGLTLTAFFSLPTPNFLSATPDTESLPDNRPNVLLIVTDDQPLQTLSVMPRTRRYFVRRGRRYSRGFVTTPLCCPSRGTIFSGRYAHNHGATTNNSGPNLDPDLTIQRYLHDSGYATAIAGKYLNGVAFNVDPPHFDRWAVTKVDDHSAFDANINGTVREVTSYSTAFFRRRALAFLRQFEANDQQPWFLVVTPAAPHAPYTPSNKYADAPIPRWHRSKSSAERKLGDKPTWVHLYARGLEQARDIRRQQLRMLMSVDDMVGAIARRLRHLGERRNTLAIFISDNGYLYGDHGLLEKRVPYTRSIKVPFMIRWPDRVEPGKDSRWAANVDIAPTIMNAAGLEALVPMDGRSLLTADRRPHLFTEFMRDIHYRAIPAWASVRTARYQYVRYYNDEGDLIFHEYYNLVRDPSQLRNLLHDGDPSNDPSTRRARRLIRRYRSCSGATCP